MSENVTTPQEAALVWAIIELMGHVKYGGQVSKDNQFGTAMLRVDVPQQDGTFVSQLVNPTSLYRLTMCSEELARAAAKGGQMKPMDSWELKHLLPALALRQPHPDEDDHGDPDDDPDDGSF